jgi:hypothetical protein
MGRSVANSLIRQRVPVALIDRRRNRRSIERRQADAATIGSPKPRSATGVMH